MLSAQRGHGARSANSAGERAPLESRQALFPQPRLRNPHQAPFLQTCLRNDPCILTRSVKARAPYPVAETQNLIRCNPFDSPNEMTGLPDSYHRWSECLVRQSIIHEQSEALTASRTYQRCIATVMDATRGSSKTMPLPCAERLKRPGVGVRQVLMITSPLERVATASSSQRQLPSIIFAIWARRPPWQSDLCAHG